jgi:hypothetical protein
MTSNVFQSTFRIVVSVNGDSSYDPELLRQAGADDVIMRPVNVGGNANICLAFEQFARSKFVWILSDDDPISPRALAVLSDALVRAGECDLVLLADVIDPVVMHGVSTLDQLESAPLSYVSCAVFGRQAFEPHVEDAFRGCLTFFPHAFVIQAALASGKALTVELIPAQDVIDLTPMWQQAIDFGRGAMGARTGAFFFGGGIMEYLEPRGQVRRRRTRRWWRQHWHRLSMYRRAESVESILVDRLGRSGLTSLPWWVISLPPWWRLKDTLDTRREVARPDPTVRT